MPKKLSKAPPPPATLRHSFHVPFEAWAAVARASKSVHVGRSSAADWWRAPAQWKSLVLPQLRALNPHCRLGGSDTMLRFRAPHVRQWKLGSYAHARLSCTAGQVDSDTACDVKYQLRILDLPKPGAMVRFDVEQTGGEPSLRHSLPRPVTPPNASVPEDLPEDSPSTESSVPNIMLNTVPKLVASDPNSSPVLKSAPKHRSEPESSRQDPQVSLLTSATVSMASNSKTSPRTLSFTVPWEAWDALARSAKPQRDGAGRLLHYRAGSGWRDWVLPRIEAANAHCRMSTSGALLRFRCTDNKARKPVNFASVRLCCRRERTPDPASGDSESSHCDVKYVVRILERPREGEDVTFVLEESGGVPSLMHSTPAEKPHRLRGARKEALLNEVEQFPGSLREFVVGKQLEGSPVPSFQALYAAVKRNKSVAERKATGQPSAEDGSDAMESSIAAEAKPRNVGVCALMRRRKTSQPHIVSSKQVPKEKRRLVSRDEKVSIGSETTVPSKNAKPETIEAVSAEVPSDAALVAELMGAEEQEESFRDSDLSFEEIEKSPKRGYETLLNKMPHEKSENDVLSTASVAQELIFDENLFTPDVKSTGNSPASLNLSSGTRPFPKDEAEKPQLTEELSEAAFTVDEAVLGDLCSESDAVVPGTKYLFHDLLYSLPQDSKHHDSADSIGKMTPFKAPAFVQDKDLFPPKAVAKHSGSSITPETSARQPVRTCALCSSKVPEKDLEAHVRLELAYFVVRCRLCSAGFVDREQAELHFRSPFAAHPSAPVSLAEHREMAKERRLIRLLQQSNEL